MSKKLLSYQQTGYFSKLICDYLAENDSTQAFYHRFPTLDNFKQQIEDKRASFSPKTRLVLVKQLQLQYTQFQVSEATQENITSLANENTFTVTTGHQLNLFTGPLYFLYKIISVINLSEQLNKAYPKQHFVPVYWMATEDHDFDEINYFNLLGKKVAWERSSSGAVGELSTEGLEAVLESLKRQFGSSENGKKLAQLFSDAYTAHDTLADATRFLGNRLFQEYGLVILDGNDIALKENFAPYVAKELTEQVGFKEINATTKRLIDAGYGEQVHPREINLFYISEGIRERIIEKEGTYFINDTDLTFSSEEILKELAAHPERFSPNALLRPLYQEVILPNLCYTGGGGELAYWFQLKDYFKSVGVPFPMLLLRNSAMIVPRKISEKLEKLSVSIESLFQKQHQLKTEFTKQISDIEIDFSTQRAHLQQQFKELYKVAEQTDTSFLGAVAAQEKKQLNGLDHLEKRLLKAQKRKLADQLARLISLQDVLFPKENLQERMLNFSEFYLDHGEKLISVLKEQLDPVAHQFTVIEL